MTDCLGDSKSQFISMINYSPQRARPGNAKLSSSIWRGYSARKPRWRTLSERWSRKEIRYYFRLLPFGTRSFVYRGEQEVNIVVVVCRSEEKTRILRLKINNKSTHLHGKVQNFKNWKMKLKRKRFERKLIAVSWWLFCNAIWMHN